ncbi:MAG: ABC transporter substrate-binding protein [Rhodobacterales bacterium]|nr:ABC transporter substrate-binding protein [Rhodobacterales bacterium]MDX5501571.1 ABC transporter substrate-binding protein [Rhodobacterales bacterium]
MTYVSRLLSSAALAIALAGSAAQAADLTYAISAPVTAVDPHYQNATPNNAALGNIFEALTVIGPDGMVHPSLAKEWRLVDDVTWEFDLVDATFHDGSPFTAADVEFSLLRPATITNSPSSFTIYTRPVKEIQIVDDHKIRVVTNFPYPQFLRDLSRVAVVKKAAVDGASTPDFNSGKVAIGTGPYKFAGYTPDDQLNMTRFDGYWGDKPAWDNVRIRFITDDGARSAALLSGSVDAIENVPTTDLERFKSNPDLVFESAKSMRVVFLFVDSGRDQPPTVMGHDGKPLDKNPLKDVRVRQAISYAINREAIRDRLMSGLAYPTWNIVFEGGEGNIPALDSPVFDANKAKALLAEAGYPDGFQITLATPNNRLINDEQVAQGVAQMLTRVGIKTQVDAMPFTMVNTRGNGGEFAFSMMAWGNTADAAGGIRAMIACKDKDKGMGPVNWGNYCNPKLDEVTMKAMSTMDTDARKGLMAEAAQIVHDDMAIVPLYWQGSTWAARKGIDILPRADEQTRPSSFTPKN